MALLRNLLRKAQRRAPDANADSWVPASTPDVTGSPSDATTVEDIHRLASQGRFGEALALADQSLAVTSDDATLLLARASTLFEWGRYHEALPCFQRAEALGSDNFNLYLRAGWTCMWTVGPAAAEPWMRKAATANDEEWSAHFGVAASLRGQGKTLQAIAAFEVALELSPGNVHCLGQLADCMLALKDPGAAEKYARRAIAANSTTPVAWTNLGVALVSQDRFDEARAAFEHAERLADTRGSDWDQNLNLGMCLREAGNVHEALELYRRKLPGLLSIGVNTHYAHALLGAGKLLDGWWQYEFRWMQAPLVSLRPSFRKPVWAGQDLRGKTVLLRTEQGVGDVIQFIRYAPHVKALGARVVLQLRAGVGDLAQGFPGIDAIPSPNEPYPEFDYYIHLLSLPRVFGTELASVPADVPYITTDPGRGARWKQRLACDAGFKVAIVWAGDPNHIRDRYRSISLSALAPLAGVEGVHFYSLQKGPPASQAGSPPAGMHLTDLGPSLDDFADTAAVIHQMDLVISVDTSVAHLAGALGKRVWMLTPTPPEWRWMAEGERTPWYPTMRLFRQRRMGHWNDVVDRMREALVEVARAGGSAVARENVDRPSARRTLLPAARKPDRFPGQTAAAETAVGILQYFPDQPNVGASLDWYGEYLRPQTDLLASMLKPGSTVVEVGAGIGAQTLALAPALTSAGHLFLYESRPSFQQVLRNNLGANGIGNVTVMKGSLKGECREVADAADADASTDSSRAADNRFETVDALRLNALQWLKINDASDALEVLDGAAESLWRLRPKLFIAVPDKDAIASIASRIRDYGYQCWSMETPYFNRGNFNRRDTDIFAGQTAQAVVAVPEEADVGSALHGCTRLQ